MFSEPIFSWRSLLKRISAGAVSSEPLMLFGDLPTGPLIKQPEPKRVEFGRRSFMALASGLLVPIEEYEPQITYVFVHRPEPDPKYREMWENLSPGMKLAATACLLFAASGYFSSRIQVSGP